MVFFSLQHQKEEIYFCLWQRVDTQRVHVGKIALNNFTFLFLSTSPAHKYYLAMDPMSESLYLSDTNTRKVYKLRSLVETKDLSKNFEVVAGTGDQCLPFDQSHCGDGGRASEASLNSPRGKKNKITLWSSKHVIWLHKNEDHHYMSISKFCL